MIVATKDAGLGGPLHVTFRVSAIGSTDAAYQAKAEARSSGYRVKTLIAYAPAASDEPSRTDRADWYVTLAVRPAA